jgi:ABC-type xylose transport system substrate-binding protein
MSDQGPPTRNLRLAPPANPHANADDQLSTELDAIITIGRALSHIPDAETRTRVMRWAIDRFSIDVTAPAEPGSDLVLPASLASAAGLDTAAADSLKVDGLSEMFPGPYEHVEPRDADFPSSRRVGLERRRMTIADRLRRVLHWMGI